MVGLDALSAKQDALDLCLKRRESILRELFRATLAFRRTRSRDAANYSEESFLDSNNILEARQFNDATLPSIPGSPSDGLNVSHLLDESKTSLAANNVFPQTSESSVLPVAGHIGSPGISKEQESSAAIISDAKELLREVDQGRETVDESQKESVLANGDNGRQESASAGLERPSRLDASTTSGDVGQTAAATTALSQSGVRQDGISPSAVLPKSSDDAGSLPQSTAGNIVAEQIPGAARTVHLPPRHVQEQRREDADGGAEKSTSVSANLSVGDEHPYLTPDESKKSDSTPTVARRSSQDLGDADVDSHRSHDSILRAQMEIARKDAASAGVPATPDEQLLQEEAHAMQLSDLPSTVLQAPQEDVMNPVSEQQSAVTNDLDLENAPASSMMGAETQDKAVDEKQNHDEADMPTPGIRDNSFPGMTGSLSRDLTFSRRPPMRIDTTVAPVKDSLHSLPGRKTMTAGMTPFTPSETATSTKSGPSTSQIHSPPERMTTRVSSGALRHKSVSEILGETPRHSSFQTEKGSSDKAAHEIPTEEHALHSPRSAVSITSPDSAAFKQRLNEIKDKGRSKLSTVVFARQQHPNVTRNGDVLHNHQDSVSDGHAEPKDYFLSLFAAQATTAPASLALHSLVVSAHKTLTTAEQYIDSQEQQDCRVLQKIYQLQHTNRWSLRQTERSVEPGRPKAHWDVLLSQMKWMRMDFREERKWKLAAAKSIADACAEWIASSSEGRALLQVKLRPLRTRQESRSTAETPDLIPSAEDDSDITDFEIPELEVGKRGAPASLFSLPPDMFIFGLDQTPVTEKILSELPLYRPSMQIEDIVLQQTSDDAEDEWKKPIIPVSKFVEGKIITQDHGPPRKKSRYDHSRKQDSPPLGASQYSRVEEEERDELAPEEDGVALFRPENKHIRDRIHAGHAFRPPTEHLMPPQSFFESRLASQWTQAEDDELRRLIREYAFNWSLISSCLSSSSLFSSGPERRTPWECFERWISLEGLPGDMSKTQYFKAYHTRLQQAQRSYEAQQQALQQHQGNNGQLPLRRRTTLPFLVERRKNNKHLHLVDAMRKLAKKRETAVHKQQHVAGLAAMRKQNEAVQPRTAMHTPQEFSRVKYERELKVQENTRIYQAQVMQQREKAKNQQRLNNGPNTMPRGPSYPPTGNAANSNIGSGMPNGHGPAGPMGQMRPIPPAQRLPNGNQMAASLPSNSPGVPHAPMQPQLQQRVSAQMIPDARLYQSVSRLQDQQREEQIRRQHQQPQSNGQAGNSASPPNMTNLNAFNQNNAAVQNNASIYGGPRGGSGSPSVNGAALPGVSSLSPRMTNPSQPQPLSSGMIPMINQMQNQIKAHNPQASPDQVNKMTTERLDQYRVTQQQAMRAAAGNPNATGMNGLASQPSQQRMINGVHSNSITGGEGARAQYNASMLSQQSQQSRNAAGGIGATRPASRSGTPQTHPGHAPSQSPRPPQAQMAGGQ